MAIVFIPSLMQRLTDGSDKVTVQGQTLRQVINNLEAAHPGVKERLVDEEGHFQEGVAIAIDGELAQLGLLERVGETSEVHIIPAIGGG
jgi:molybdopterin synthase sulfur carrier subunit